MNLNNTIQLIVKSEFVAEIRCNYTAKNLKIPYTNNRTIYEMISITRQAVRDQKV